MCSLNKPIAMGYIEQDFKIGAKVKARVRNKLVEIELTKMPFVPAKYYRP